jgi:hypothetical protein
VSQVRSRGHNFTKLEAEAAVHTDAAELGVGTYGPDMKAGALGVLEDAGVWTQEERKGSITLRELKALTLVHGRSIGMGTQKDTVRQIRCYLGNLGVKHVVAKMVSANDAIMKELRALQKLLRRLGLSIQTEWLPSAANFYAYRLSRSWDPGDVQVTRWLRESLRSRYSHVVGTSGDV